ncbi:hypothetical protein FA15DRAFT_597228 [Coprinopsis marcescibilis]|uniref:C2H2-type domain-containing protein n=1 Tax=Coprinopsis marcescibilis TaxID=230819 RepID=A0A5C3KMZ8_COPMA|nr:hypothetical protein FA15DRAFT_597228 [Coprinopsis marcescibilis]
MEQDSKPTARQSALCPLQTSVGTQRGAQSFPPSQIPDADLSFKNEEDAAGQLPKKKKKSKMHPCEICDKKFPRPSGLKTHMNTHNNARPYPCGYPGCTRTFGVRSNAKRHLRTHGVLQSPNEGNNEPPYVVGFSAPVLSNSYDSGQPGGYPGLDGEVPRHQMVKTFKLRWMPPSLNSRKNAALLKPVSEDGQFSDDDEDDDEDPHSLLVLSGSRHEGISLSSASSTSSSAGHASCVCSTPCSSTPCSSLIGANTALPAYRPSSLISIAAAVSSVRDTPYDGVSYGTSQVYALPTFRN